MVSVSDPNDAMHKPSAPMIAEGDGRTVIEIVELHPANNVYVIVVVPEAIPSTIPDAPTIPTAVLLLLQDPLHHQTAIWWNLHKRCSHQIWMQVADQQLTPLK